MPKSIFAILVLFVLILVFSPAGDAQSGGLKPKPDFSGKWLLDTRQSRYGMTGRSDLPITISHHDPEFRITVPYEPNNLNIVVEVEYVYFTDKRGEYNEGTDALWWDPADPEPKQPEKKPNSKTEWSGDKIVIVAWLRRGNFVNYQQRDEWRLSRDGKVLTQYRRVQQMRPDPVTIHSPWPDEKMVYNRIEKS